MSAVIDVQMGVLMGRRSFPEARSLPRQTLEVVMAEAFGMCFGVRDAVKLAESAPEPTALTVLGELVHNPAVLQRLDQLGVRRTGGWDPAGGGTPAVETSAVMVTAHGASSAAIQELQKEFHVIDATCPLVRHAHRSALRLVKAGYYPVIIGDPQHVEVRGLVGDLEQWTVVRGQDELHQIPDHPRLGVLSQTTQTVEHVQSVVDALRRQRPNVEIRYLDTVCQPTKDRQTAARRLAARCEAVVVVGGPRSNNTRQLVATIRREGCRAFQVEQADQVDPGWFIGLSRVGLTAGTSTPDEVVDRVRRRLESIPVSGPLPSTVANCA